MAKAPRLPRPNAGLKVGQYASLGVAIIPQDAAGSTNDSRCTKPNTNYRSWADCGGRPHSLVRERSSKAGRVTNCIPTNSLCQFHGAGQRLHWVECNPHRSILCGFYAAEHALVYLSSTFYHGCSVSFSSGLLLTQNGRAGGYSRLHNEYRISDRTGSNADTRHEVSEGYRLQQFCYKRTQRVYGYGFHTSCHIHTDSSHFSGCTSFPFHLAPLGPGLLICPGGLGGGEGRGGAGALATKVSFLESLDHPRMGKKGGLGNQFSHMGDVA